MFNLKMKYTHWTQKKKKKKKIDFVAKIRFRNILANIRH
jgi:hypothetical protein